MRLGVKVLLIDDDQTLAKALELYLCREGYEVHLAATGAEGLRALYSVQPALVLLDVMIPEMDGWETCRRIRELTTVPIIMLTAKGQEIDRVRGLRMGADDYVPKPFALKELVARMEAILRRTRRDHPEDTRGLVYESGDLVIDAGRYQVYQGGQPVELSVTELKLLFFLAENAGRVLSHRQILERVWGEEYAENVEYTKLYIWRLRQKLEKDPNKPQLIISERGQGYRLVLPE